MKWTISGDLRGFPAAAEAWLLRDPVLNTLPITIFNRLRLGDVTGGTAVGWLGSDDGSVLGVALQAPPYPVVFGDIPPDAIPPLAEALAGRPVSGVTGPLDRGDAFVAAWHRPVAARMPQRLYRLGTLRAVPAAGSARMAVAADLPIVARWYQAFTEEAEPAALGGDPAWHIRPRIERNEMVLWQISGRPVAMAAFSRPESDISRLGPVYTPPGRRGRGYGSAVTRAATVAALARGAGEVLLFTDLANPTSNHIYQELGYRPVADYVAVWFG